ncbi:universal stress protein [Marixanthomonas spongiae]|uniref:Universal stress protein n=1 Tax=Marixanthomonas spongiae TaxID=2174845 RepID=A0A2U0I430_9FLAO|nr:universal stress protein [Marixanthomonas spongiae]PVW15875.1 universal stress protein [Marixanthomonas spongiae]
MQKIIIPTDFSDNAQNAIRYAVELFKYNHCEITLLHAFADEVYENNLDMSRSLFEEYKEKVEESATAELENVLEATKKMSPNPRHTYSAKAVFATLVDAVNDLAETDNSDIVVMGTRGHTDDRDLLFGSNTLQVVKYVSCPVLAVPSKYTEWHPKQVLFSTPYLMPFKRRELKLLNTLCKNFKATINFLYVSEFEKLSFRQQDNKAFLDSCLADNLKEFHTAQGTDVVETINAFINDKHIDMLVMVNERRSFLENVLFTNTIDKIGLKVQVPFLIFQNVPR